MPETINADPPFRRTEMLRERLRKIASKAIVNFLVNGISK